MARCEICGKGPHSGHKVSHAENKTNRRWHPNVQKHTIYRDGRQVKLNLCTRCLRTLSKKSST